MKNRISTRYYLKSEKVNKKGLSPIYLRITVNGTRAEISSNRRVSTDDWDKSLGRASGRSEQARIINTALIALQSKVDNCFLRIDTGEKLLTAYEIVDELRGRKVDNVTLMDAFKHHLAEMRKLIGTDYSEKTVLRYEVVLNSLEEYLDKIYYTNDIRLRDLDARFIESYNTFLKGTKGLQHNTVVKNIKIIKRVIHVAIINRWLPEDPFREINVGYRETYRGYLTQEEIENIYKKEFTLNRLGRVRDCFIFQVYTGLAHTDLLDLTADDIQTGIDGGRWIVIKRKKTGGRSSIPLLPRAEAILTKYANDPWCLVMGKLLPVSSNQKMNAYLKEIGDLCGITKRLTTHLARHTFATTITLSSGVPIETVSKMLGHADLKTTQIYSKVVDRKVADDMRHLMKGAVRVEKKRLEG